MQGQAQGSSYFHSYFKKKSAPTHLPSISAACSVGQRLCTVDASLVFTRAVPALGSLGQLARRGVMDALYRGAFWTANNTFWMLDFKFLVGTLLGWRFVCQVFGRPDAADPDAHKQLQTLKALVASLKEQLSKQDADLTKKDRDLADAASRLAELEFAKLTLETQICQLEAKEVRLEADLEAGVAQLTAQNARLAADNAALQEENRAVLEQLRTLLLQASTTAAAAAAAAPTQQATAGEPAGADGDSGGADSAGVLRNENAQLRQQLEAVTQQNADLQERLMALAFMPPAEHSEGSFSPEQPRRPRHRPLAEDEEIQRRIAESAAQVALFEEAEASGGQSPSPLLAAAQRQLQAYQEIKQRLGGSGTQGGAPVRSSSSGADSPQVTGSPTGVLSVSSEGGGAGKSGEALTAAEGEEVSSSG